MEIIYDDSEPELVLTPEQASNEEDLVAWLCHWFSYCACGEEIAVVKTIVEVLDWATTKDKSGFTYKKVLSGEVGAFYLVICQLNVLGLVERGTSIRYAWITENGKKVLDALKAIDWDKYYE